MVRCGVRAAREVDGVRTELVGADMVRTVPRRPRVDPARPTIGAMSAIWMDGNALADELKADMAARVAALAERGITPGLGTILVGDDGPSARYVGMKHHDCAELGMHSVDRRLPADATQDQVLAAVAELNADPSVDAFIVQYPFPRGPGLRQRAAGGRPGQGRRRVHPVNLGLLVMGRARPRRLHAAGDRAHAVGLRRAGRGRHVVIVGRGLTIGRPLANLLTLKGPDTNAAVTVVHTGVEDLGAYTRTADIVVAAAGSPA